MKRGDPAFMALHNGQLAHCNGPTRFAGYAAIFDSIDQGGDIIRKGAFAASLVRLMQADGRLGLPLLWQHDAAQPIGEVESLAEDARGLRIVGRIFSSCARGRAAADDLRRGVLTGLSFGYRTRGSQMAHEGAARELTALDLVEISLVTAPMQPFARVHAVEPVLPP
jgi:uncharacterized protein